VTCRVLKLARQPYYRWLKEPVTDRELDEAHLANALVDAHHDDPEFGYRFLADEVEALGFVACERTVWKRCSENGLWSSFGKKSSRRGRKVGPPVHDDLVCRDFKADAPNELWLSDITEHRTDEGKLYLCAVKDVFSNRIVGYSIDHRMKARLVVQAIDSAAARRGDVAGCILHSDRGSQGEFNRLSQHPVTAEVSVDSSTTGCGSCRTTKDEVAGPSRVAARSPAAVLDRDCQGTHSRRSGHHCRLFPTRRAALVP
jgi:putative transposase